MADIEVQPNRIPGLEEMVTVQLKGGKGGLVAYHHPKKAEREIHLIEKQIDVLGVVADDPQDIAKVVEVVGQKIELEAQLCIVMERQRPLRGQVKAGPPVLDRLVVVKTQTKGGDSLTGRRQINVECEEHTQKTKCVYP